MIDVLVMVIGDGLRWFDARRETQMMNDDDDD
jgi:hypothetical protein